MGSWANGTCPQPGSRPSKTRYRSRSAAMKALRQVRDSATGPVAVKSVYLCKRCGGWHMTKRERAQPSRAA